MVFNNNLLLGAAGQGGGVTPFDPTLIGNSVWIDGSADYLNRTPSSAGTTTRWIVSCWVQRNKIYPVQTVAQNIFSAGTALGNLTWIRFDDLDHLDFAVYQGSPTARKTSSAQYKDVGWYHICVSFDSGSGIAAGDRIRLFVNGIEVTDLSDNTDTPSGETTAFNDNVVHEIGRYSYLSSQYISAYLAQFTMLENKSFQNGDLSISDLLDSFTFGTNGSQYVPKADADIAALATTAGGNSFCLDFADSGDLGNDISSNANDFTPNSMSSVNQTGSSPSSAFATWNPLRVNTQTQTFAEGNLRFSSTQTSTNPAATGNYGVSSGKFYWEVFVVAQGNTSNMLGICDVAAGLENDTTALYTSALMYSYEFAGTKRNNNISTSYGDSITNGDIVGIALDMDNGGVYFSKNGTFQASGDPTSGPSLTNAAFTGLNSAGSGTFQPYYLAYSNGDGVANFGQSPTFNGQTTAGGNTDANGRGNFKYPVPSGYSALTSANLTAPDYQGIDYFDATLYQGNGTGQRVGDFVPFTDAYNVDNSAMFDSADLRYLARTPSSGGNEKTFTFSTWIKITGVGNNLENAVLTTDDGSKEAQIRISGTTLATKKVTANLYNGSSFILNISTDRTFGDTSSWNHLVVAYDTRAAVASADKVIIYINGVRQSVSGTLLTVDDYETEFNSTNEHNIGRQSNNGIGEADFYLAETVMIDGQQLDASSFGQLDTSTNRWIPKDVSGLTFGTNGFYLEYKSTFGTGSGAGTDTSGNSNNWTESTDGGSAWTTSDQFIDTPTKNFATLDPTYGYNNTTYAQGNLAVVGANVASQANKSTYSTAFSKKSGKWWVEFDSILNAGNTTVFYGIIPTKYIRDGSFVAAAKDPGTGYADNLLGSIRAYIVGSTYGNKVYNITIGTGSGTINLTSGGIIDNNAGGYTELVPYGIALDMDNKKMWIGNPTISATTWNNETGVSPADNTGGFDLEFDEYSIFISNSLGTGFINFGQYVGSWNGNSVSDYTSTTGGNFTLEPPTGFKAINQDNLDDTSSKITALAWIKNRDATDNHMLANRVRGPQFITNSNSNSTGETTNVNAIQRFLQRGVQVGSDVNVNTANEAYVLWQWLMGDSATTGTTTSPAGSIASTTIVADADHMSIGTFTGTGSNGTVGHGLSAAPEAFVVFNPTVAARFKMFYHKDSNASPASGYIHLESTEDFKTDSTIYNNTVPTSTVFSVGTNLSINESGALNTFIAWRSVPGVCKVGSYIGNGNADGPYIDLGFKPSFFLFRVVDSGTDAYSWIVFDTSRSPIPGSASEFLHPNSNSAAYTSSGSLIGMDFLSNGMKQRSTHASLNQLGKTYVYLAMADIGGSGTLPPIYGI